MAMRRVFLATVLGLAVLVAPMAMKASNSLQAESQSEARRRDVSEHRVYDRDRKDYHDWNENEDRAYRRYWESRHRAYRDYERLNRREQSHYWSWRHSHPDHDRGN